MPGKHARPDATDRRILRALQDHGRMPNVGIARLAGLSPPPCLRRIRSLETAGFIRGYHADLDPLMLGWQVTFMALVGLDRQSEAVLDAFERRVGTWPEVRECHMIRGGGDFLLKIVARDTPHENEITTRLTGAPHVTNVTTFQVIRSAKSRPGVPVRERADEETGTRDG